MTGKGTIYRKADLHIHTPASNCFSTTEKSVTAAQIVEEAKRKGLEIIGITDHNDITFVESIREEAKKIEIIVFPGVEISTQEAHLLALFEPDCSIEALNEFLPSIGIRKEHRGKKDAMAGHFEDTLMKIREYGGIAIAAHANSDNGILHSAKSGTYRKAICNHPELCALELINKEHIDGFTAGKIPNYPAKACVCGSDAHCLAEIGQRHTYLKMDVVSINGLRQALADFEVKVRFPWDFTESSHPRILSLTVNQGFFKDVDFKFHHNLTCFIGGTGTGKSTLIEFLRYCFNDISSFEDIRDDTYGKVEKLIGAGGKITVEYITESGERISISREVSDPLYREEVSQTIVDEDGQETLMPNRPVFFSQGEMARIAMNPIAQLELIDKYIDISDGNRLEQEMISKLDTNASELVEVIDSLRSLNEMVNDPENGKSAIEKERDRLQEQLKSPIFAEFPKWESEARFIKQAIEGVDELPKAVEESLSSISIEEYFPISLGSDSPNFKKLQPLNDLSHSVRKIVDKLTEQFKKEVSNIKIEVDRLNKEFQPLFDKKKAEYEQFLTELGEDDINKAQKRLRALTERLGELAEIEAKAKILSQKETKIHKEREGLLKQLQELRHRRLSKRVTKAEEWETKLNHKIKIDIEANRDVSTYLPTLVDMTTGSYAKKLSIVKIALAIQPWEIVKAVINNDAAQIQKQSGIDSDEAQKIVDFLKYKPLKDLLSLETTPISDTPIVSFEVERSRFKPINELATGTKSIVVVSLAMIEGNAPLVIDQPEDSLNTEFIYSEVVNRLRGEKESRQFVFASHNPNIVVSGETDLTHVLSATADQGSVVSSGGIDHPKTNELMLLHLEGGPDAFKLRAQKYGQSMV